MCGIVGILSNKEVTPTILDVLKKLEYRGYDSAGIATIYHNNIKRQRAKGKIGNLIKLINKDDLPGKIGIGHTRWATHGIPSEDNAHPHHIGSVVGVHNGIIENFREIKEELSQKGYQFSSDTDTEVIIQLCSYYIEQGFNNKDAFLKTIKRLKGAFALCLMFKDDDKRLYATKRSAPLVIGYGESDIYVGSDAVSLSNLINKVIFLDEDDVAVISKKETEIFNKTGKKIERKKKSVELNSEAINKGNYQHFMLKEIYEQPEVFTYATSSFINFKQQKIEMLNEFIEFDNIDKIIFVACGTAFYACAVAKYWFEKYVKVSVEIDVASEFRYRDNSFGKNEYAIFVSQSGETADTLAALRKVKGKVKKIISIVNVIESSIARESDFILPIKAGPEIGVASTKAFTSQVVTLSLLGNFIGQHLGVEKTTNVLSDIKRLSSVTEKLLKLSDEIFQISKIYANSDNFLYLGRGYQFPVALEGALKLKEISYIHAEGYPAAEMKHGPIALIDEKMPVVFIVTPNGYSKILSNIQEVKARGGKIIVITLVDPSEMIDFVDHVIYIENSENISNSLSPILTSIPLQLLSYHIAVLKGCDVDQPRNLAKSVTLE